MSEGEHTIIGKIPRERLNQIASRKLSALGIPVRLGADRETLEGDLAFARLLHPGTSSAIARGRFVVVGHDRLRFLDPPLSALGEVSFYDHERAGALEQALAAALQHRSAALQGIAAHFRALRLEASLDPDRLAVRTVVKTRTHAFEILGAPDGVRISRVAPVGGAPFEVASDFPLLDLAAFGSATDLVIFLADAVGGMTPASSPSRPPAAAPASGAPEPMPPPRNALTLAALAQAFGDEAILAPNAMVELIQDFQHGGTRYRFVAAREMGTRFRGRLIGPSGDIWSDGFELAEFSGIRRMVALALGLDSEAQPEVAPGTPGSAPAAASGLQPRPGEVWVMNVMVEEAGADDVRYVGTDMDGRPYGAARVLNRADFEAVFTEERGTWRLLILLEQVQDSHVIYRQLDRHRQPMGAPRKIPAAVLVANFVPETAG